MDVGSTSKKRRVDIDSTKVRKRRSDLGSKRKDGASKAAIKYGAKYLSELRFLRCGCCLREDSSSKFMELSTVKEAGLLNYLRNMKSYILMHLRRPESTNYDKTFSDVYQDFVNEDGIFGNSRYICLECYKDLRKVNRKITLCHFKINFNLSFYIYILFN